MMIPGTAAAGAIQAVATSASDKTAITPLRNAVLLEPGSPTFGEALGSAIDSLSSALGKADALAASVAQSKTSIADATVARAKADVMLEVAAITAAKVSGAITQLLQTQL